MLQALQAWGNQYPFTIEVVDVETDQLLVAQYDKLVPVLLGCKNGAAPVQLCHHFLDEKKLERFLQSSVLH
jgi:hypothetical protein